MPKLGDTDSYPVVGPTSLDRILATDAETGDTVSFTVESLPASGGTGTGDMTKAVYDPTTVAGDTFAMDNMVEGTLTKILTATERTAIVVNTAKETNVAHPLVETAVPVGAVFTDTDTIYDDTAIQAEVDLNTAKVSFDSTSSTRLANTSGTNTGDQDLSTYQLKPSEGAFVDGDKTKLDSLSGGGGGTALATTYDNTDSTLLATNVKAGLDELDIDVNALSSGFQGSLAIADTPTLDGYYMASESGTYTNAGSVVSNLTLGANVITKVGVVYSIVTIPITSILAKDSFIEMLEETEDNFLSIPFFDSRYVTTSAFTNNVHAEETLTQVADATGNSVESDHFVFTGSSKYELPANKRRARFDSYMCFAYKWMNGGDNVLLGGDEDNWTVMIRTSNMLVGNVGGTAYDLVLPVGWDRTQPFVVQIVAHDKRNLRVYINGELLAFNTLGSTLNNSTYSYIGRNTLGNLKALNAHVVYYKVANALPTKTQINQDLYVLNNIMGNVSTTVEITDPFKRVKNVILLAGQSNGDGRGVSSSVRDLRIATNAYEYDTNSLAMKPFGLYIKSATSDMGVEPSLFNQIDRQTKYDDIDLVKYSPGGTAFYTNDWNVGDGSYNILVNKVLGYKELKTDYELAFTLVWIHGESDGDTAITAAAYEAACIAMFTQLKIDIDYADLKICIARLNPTQNVPEVTAIRTAQDNIIASDANYYLVDLDTLTVSGTHYDAANLIEFGYLIYDVMDANDILASNELTI